MGVEGGASKVMVIVLPLTLATVPLTREPPKPPPAAPPNPLAAPAPANADAPAPLVEPAAPVNAPPVEAPRIRDAKLESALVVDAAAWLLPYQMPAETDAVITTRPARIAVYLLVHL